MRAFAGFLAALLLSLPACRKALPEGPVPADSPLALALRLPVGQPVEPDGPPTRAIPAGIAERGPLVDALKAASPRDVACQAYEGRALAIVRIQACVFEFDGPEAACGVADAFPEGRRVVVGPEARVEGGEIRFAQGSRFVVARTRASPSEAWPSLLYFGHGVARQLQEAGGGDFAVRFPARDRLDERPSFLPVAAFGLEGVDVAWRQRYRVDGHDMDGFYVFHGSADEARETFARYLHAFRMLGGDDVPDAEDCGVRVAFDAAFAAFVQGHVFGGVHMADDAEAARRLCRELREFAAGGGGG